MKRIALTIAAAISLAACGQPAGWTPPPGATRQSFERDAYECRRDALAGGDTIRSGSIYVKSEDWSLYRDCMRAHGYGNAAPGQGWFPSWGRG